MRGVKRYMNNYDDDLFYLCTMIEYVARVTHNKTRKVVEMLSDSALLHELKAASVNHCLSFEQVCDEWIEKYNIKNGNFDNISTCKYNVPSEMSIGRVYQTLISSICSSVDDVVENIRKVFNSFISDEISDFNSNVYYSNPNYIKCSYEEGQLLA